MPLWQPMQLFKNKVLTPPGLRVMSWRIRSGGRVVSITSCRSLHKWFNMVKRNIARLVPLMKKALAAPRVVITPAVAAPGVPLSAGWGLETKCTLRAAVLACGASDMGVLPEEKAGAP